MDMLISFCPLCGNNLSLRIPEADDRERHVCDACGHVHYLNPRIVVCALPCFEDKVLLCKRAIEPRYGLWTLPGGFMENGESTMTTARRETWEEACAHIAVHELYALYNVIHINQVHLFFRASLLDMGFAAGPESLEVGLYGKHEVPWDAIAFPAVAGTLRHYFEDLDRGSFPMRIADVVLGANNERLIVDHDANRPSST